MSQGHVMPNQKQIKQQIGSGSSQLHNKMIANAQHAASNYNAALLQNAYNPYSQQSYVASMTQTIMDWQLEKTFCINGEWMNLEEFVTHIYPEDCPERTFLILKLRGQKDEDNS